MAGRFGLYSRRKYEKAGQTMHLYEFVRTTIATFRKSNEMSLVEVWHADYELLYYYVQDVKTVLKT